MVKNESQDLVEKQTFIRPLSPTKKSVVLKLIEEARNNGLSSLDLSRKGLTEIPASLFSLEGLKELYLEGNRLSSIPGDFFDRLPLLEWLDLRGNRLRSLPSGYLGRHRHLRNLLLEDNCLHSLPPELGSVLTLTGLNIRKNPLEFPPAEIREQGTSVIVCFLKAVIDAKATGQAQIVDYSAIVDKVLRMPSASVMQNLNPFTTPQAHANAAPAEFPYSSDSASSSNKQRTQSDILTSKSFPIPNGTEIGGPLVSSASSAMCPMSRGQSNARTDSKMIRPAKDDRRIATRHAQELHKIVPVQKRIADHKRDSIHQNSHISQKDEVKKNKLMLNEWQQQTKIMQAEKNMSAGDYQRPIEPYGVDEKSTVKRTPDNGGDTIGEKKDRDARIRQQITEMNDRRHRSNNRQQLQSVQDAGESLQKAQQLQKQIADRKKEYRLSCFSDAY